VAVSRAYLLAIAAILLLVAGNLAINASWKIAPTVQSSGSGHGRASLQPSRKITVAGTANGAAPAAIPTDFSREAFLRLLQDRAELGDFGFEATFGFSAVGHRPTGDPVLVAFLQRWGEVDPEAALAAIASLPADMKSWEVRERYVNAILAGWSRVDPARAWEWAMASNDEVAPSSRAPFAFERFDTIAADMMERGGHASVGALLMGSHDRFSYRTGMTLMESWTEKDLKGAAAWLSNLPTREELKAQGLQPSLRAGAELGLGRGLVAADLQSTGELLPTMSDKFIAERIASGIVDVFIDKNDISGARIWLQRYATDNNAQGIFDSALVRLSLALPMDAPEEQVRTDRVLLTAI
jgi:hypothetical protein